MARQLDLGLPGGAPAKRPLRGFSSPPPGDADNPARWPVLLKVLTLHQPWASAWAAGPDVKPHETRAWQTSFRGPLGIHAAATLPAYAKQALKASPALRSFAANFERVHGGPLPLGCLLAVGRLVAVHRSEAVVRDLVGAQFQFGDYRPGRWAWQLADLRPLPAPIPCKGAQGLWTLEVEGALRALVEELRGAQDGGK